MRGDFSVWNKDRSRNFRGTLHQQGRVLLDRDWNAHTEIIGEWQETAARDAFGAGVAAVPAEVPLSFKVIRAAIAGDKASIQLKPGRVWADGLLVELFPPEKTDPGEDAIVHTFSGKADSGETRIAPVTSGKQKCAKCQNELKAGATFCNVCGTRVEGSDPGEIEPIPTPGETDLSEYDLLIRTATYLGSPLQPMNGHRDAVILETWLEELNAFQDSELLIEPALGGVDTTERVQAAFRLRLYRMADGDTCDSIIPLLKNDFSKKGKLTAELKADTTTADPCPVVESGGYTGFEHNLYRIEIADTNSGTYFKWSQFNGGLVGTGDFDFNNKKVQIFGNSNAILNSGLSEFYLEALDFDADLGCWKVIYGAKATLGSDNMLDLPDDTEAANVFKGTAIPGKPSKGRRFFRLWNGIESVAEFNASKQLPNELGIHLQFETEGAGVNKKQYLPSDFWTFEVRAGGIVNPLKLVDNLPPQGIFYHRVPLAEVLWKNSVIEVDAIDDCRQIFQPLTKLKTCCTYRVGDGIHTHGDFTRIQDAINALPRDKGGEICVLPGMYHENLSILGRYDIIIKGCGKRTIISNATASPAIDIARAQNITIESLDIKQSNGNGVNIDTAQNITLGSLDINAAGNGIDIKSAQDIIVESLDINVVGKGINIVSAENITLGSLSLEAGAGGIDIVSAHDITIESMSVSAGGKGLNIEHAYDITIELLDILKAKEKGVNIEYAQNVVLESVSIEVNGEGIVLAGEERTAENTNRELYLKDITLSHLTVTAGKGSAVRAKYAQFLTLTDSVLYMKEYGQGPITLEDLYAEVYLTGDDMLVKGNEIRVLPLKFIDSESALSNDPADFTAVNGSMGGIHIGGGSERVRIVDNLIVNGAGNGISLGGIKASRKKAFVLNLEYDVMKAVGDQGYIKKDELGPDTRIGAGPALEDILIQSNRIFNMARNGISVFGFISLPQQANEEDFFTLRELPEMISVRRLTIVENRIELCLNRNVRVPDDMLSWMGWGAIALAATEDLTVRDNFLIRNGRDLLDPVCGIYLIQTIGLDISRNHIEGPILTGINDQAADRRPIGLGARGGIWVHEASVSYVWQPLLARGPFIEGPINVPAAKIHENVVLVAMGRSLTLGASGPVSVMNNSFTTFNAPPEKPVELLMELMHSNGKLTPKLAFQLTDALAGNVIIFEREALVNALEVLMRPAVEEYRYLFVKRTQAAKVQAGKRMLKKTGEFVFGTTAQVPVPTRSASEVSFTDSNFLFSDNQCYQDRMAGQDGISVTSIFIATPNDVGFNSNQISCRLIETSIPKFESLKFPVINTYVFGRSCRVNDNRFLETDDATTPSQEEGVPFPLSAFTAANRNITTDNIGTHCILVEKDFLPYSYHTKPLYLDRFNLTDIEPLSGDIFDNRMDTICRRWPRQPGGWVNVLDPMVNIKILESYQQTRWQETIQYQEARYTGYQQGYERYTTMYGESDVRASKMAMRMEVSLAETRDSYLQYSAASTPFPEIKSGWAVDGFVRTEEGDPVEGVTIAAYDEKGVWYRALGYTCTDKKGYFSLRVEEIPENISAVFMGVSKDKKKQVFKDTKLTLMKGSSDRIELSVDSELGRGDCAAPDGSIDDDLPPDRPEDKDKKIKDKTDREKDAKDKIAKEKEAKEKAKPAKSTGKKPAPKKRK